MAVLGVYKSLVDISAPNQNDNSTGFGVHETNSYGGASGLTLIFDVFKLFDVTILSFIDIAKTTSKTTKEWFSNLEAIYGAVDPAKVLVAAAFYSGTTYASSGPLNTFLANYCPATRHCVVIRCSTWDGSIAKTTLMPHYADGIDTTYVSPFTYLIRRTGASPYSLYVTDRVDFIGARNGEASYSPRTDLLKTDLPTTTDVGVETNSIGGSVLSVIDPAQMVEYLKTRIDDAIATSPTVEIVPDTTWTRDKDDGLPTPIAHVTNNSKLVFTFTEKAVGPGDGAKYGFGYAPSAPSGTVTKTLTGLSPDTGAGTPDGLLASNYILATPVADSSDRWQLALGGFDSTPAHADDGKTITIDPAALKDGSGYPFAIGAANTSPFKVQIDVAGAAAETPTWEVIVTENPATSSERKIVIPADDATPSTPNIPLVLSTSWTLSARLLTRFPGTSKPSATLTSVPLLVFGGPGNSALKTSTPGPTAAGQYVLHVNSYLNGAGQTIPQADYIFQVRTSVAELSHWQDAIEGWGYYPLEEGLPASAAETGAAAPGIPTVVGHPAPPTISAWADGGTGATAPSLGSAGLDIAANSGATRFVSRGYAAMFANATPVGSDDSGRAYIEARLKAVPTGAWSALSGAMDYTVPSAPAAVSVCTTGAGIGANNGPCLAALELVELDISGTKKKTVAMRVYGTDGTVPAFILPPGGAAAIDWTVMHTYRLERTYSGGLYVWTAFVDGAAKISSIAESRFFRDYDDTGTRSAARFGILYPVGYSSVTDTVEFVRYALFDVKYVQDATNYASVGFANLRRAAADSPFFRSTDIRVSSLDATDPTFVASNTFSITTHVSISGGGVFSGKALPAKVRLLWADFPDNGGVASVAGFRDCGNFPAYDGTKLKPLVSAASVRVVNGTGVTASVSWSIDVDRTKDARRVFLLACVDSPVLAAPKLVRDAVCYITATATPGYFDPTEAGSTWTGDKRTVIRQFLPDFFVRDTTGDTGDSPGGWMSPDISLAVFPGPGQDTVPPVLTHVLPNPQTLAETKYPAGFACGKTIGYLPDGTSPINAQDHTKEIKLTDGAYTDYAPALGADATACYMNRVWVRPSNRGIVPGPAKIQVFFLHDVFRAEWGDKTSSRDMAYEKYVANQAGTVYIQEVFQKYTGPDASNDYTVSSTGVIPALSGAAHESAADDTKPSWVVAEFVLHVPAGTVAAANSVTTETTGDKIHGCRAAVINLIDMSTTPQTNESSGIDDCVIVKMVSPPLYPDIQSATIASNNISVRNTDLIVGSAPPPSDDPNITLMMLHVDPDTGDPDTHQDTGPGYVPTFGNTQARWSIAVDASGYPAGDVVIRVDRRLAGGAYPRTMVELIPKENGELVPAGSAGATPGGPWAKSFRFFFLRGEKKGVLEGVNAFKAIREERKPLVMPVRLYARTSTKGKRGKYSIVMQQLADGKVVGGYTLTVLVPGKGGIQFVGDRRTGIVYDAKEDNEAFNSIPFHRQRNFLWADQAVQHRMYLNPRTLEAFKANKLGTAVLNIDRGTHAVQTKEADFFPGGYVASIVGRVVDKKGNGIAEMLVEVRAEGLGAGPFKAITDRQGRYLVIAERKAVPGFKPGAKAPYAVEIRARSKDGKQAGRLSLKKQDFFFAAPPMTLSASSKR
jgi:hypothetical protein